MRGVLDTWSAAPREIVILMGAAGAGKSTLAVQLAGVAGGVVVSYDQHQRRMPGDSGVEPVSAASSR